jgi:hypothetical protein
MLQKASNQARKLCSAASGGLRNDLERLLRGLLLLQLLLDGGRLLLGCLRLLLRSFKRRLPVRKRSLHTICGNL